jgi:hypothetical protein
MTSITITLPDDEDLLTRPDETFKQAVEYVLQKNSDLYRRLA